MKRIGIAVLTVMALGLTSSAFAQDAKSLYSTKCASCHGPDAKGETTMGKKLGVKSMIGMPVASLEKYTAEGKGTKMPAYKGKLTEQQIKDIAQYIASLK